MSPAVLALTGAAVGAALAAAPSRRAAATKAPSPGPHTYAANHIVAAPALTAAVGATVTANSAAASAPLAAVAVPQPADSRHRVYDLLANWHATY